MSIGELGLLLDLAHLQILCVFTKIMQFHVITVFNSFNNWLIAGHSRLALSQR